MRAELRLMCSRCGNGGTYARRKRGLEHVRSESEQDWPFTNGRAEGGCNLFRSPVAETV
jgi:hypothetical protein